MAIFKVEDGLLVLDKEEIRGIPEYRKLLERDRGSEGDHDGRKKYQAYKEFFYIYIWTDLYSYPNKAGLNDKEKHKIALKEADLPNDFKIDIDIKNAIEKYRYVQLLTLPTLNTVSTALKGLKISDIISQSIIKNIESTLEKYEQDKKAKIERREPISIGDDMVLTQSLVSQLGQLMEIGTKLPKAIETLEKLKEKLFKEESGINLGRGGKEIGNRADPKKRD